MPLIRIIEELCDGCGECIPTCHEGALHLVDGKARLVDGAACDGAGACIGQCPRGAIVFEEEKQGGAVAAPQPSAQRDPASKCPGAANSSVAPRRSHSPGGGASALRQWPIQLHLLSPAAPFLAGSHLLLAADCAAFVSGEFHGRWLAGRTVAIACPKLDAHQELYVEKLAAMVRHHKLDSLTVLIIGVPCCSGLVRLAQAALERAGVVVPLRVAILGVDGEPVWEGGVAEYAVARRSPVGLGEESLSYNKK